MRAGQFNRRKPKNLVGGGDRPVNEFNVDFKEQRQLPASQYSGKKAKQRRLMAAMMIAASALYAESIRSPRWNSGSSSRSGRGGAGSSHSRSGSGRAGSSLSRSGSGGGHTALRNGGSRVVLSRSRTGRMLLARERSLENKRKRDERRERKKRTYRKMFAMLFGVLLVLGSYASLTDSTPTQILAPEAYADAEERSDSSPPIDWTWNMDGDLPTVTAEVEGIGTLSSTVTYQDVPARCATPGTRTYTAIVKYEDQVFRTTKTVTLPPLGHSFEEPQITTDSEGNTIVRATCTACHQTFEISVQTAAE